MLKGDSWRCNKKSSRNEIEKVEDGINDSVDAIKNHL